MFVDGQFAIDQNMPHFSLLSIWYYRKSPFAIAKINSLPMGKKLKIGEKKEIEKRKIKMQHGKWGGFLSHCKILLIAC